VRLLPALSLEGHARIAEYAHDPSGVFIEGQVEETSPPSHKRIVAAVFLLAIGIFCSRWFFAGSPRSVAANHEFDDETELTLTTADHFLGTSIGELHWPGGTNQLLLLPVLGLDALHAAHGRPTPERFAAYLSGVYREPWHAIWLARLLVAALSSIGLASLYLPFRQRLGNGAAAAACVVLLALSPIVWLNCYMGSAAGMAMAMMCAALAVGMTGQASTRRIAWVGVLLGLSLGARLVFVPVLPLLIVLVAGRYRQPLRATLLMDLWASLAFVLVCPFIWTDPIRFAKAVLGNYMKHGPPVGWWTVMRIFHGSVPLLLTFAFVAAMGVAVRRGRWAVVIGALISVLALLGPSSHAPLVTPRYFVTMPLVLMVAIAAGLPPLQTWRLGRYSPTPAAWAAGIAGLVLLASMWNGWQMIKEDRLAKAQSAPGVAVADGIRALGHEGISVAIPADLMPIVEFSASSAALRQLAVSIEIDQSRGSRVLEFTSGFGFDPRVVAALQNNFNEKERSVAARYRAAAGAEDRPGIDVRPIAPPKSHRPECLSREEAIDRWRRGELAVLVLDSPPPADAGPAVEFLNANSSDHYYWLDRRGVNPSKTGN
jgi:hypothetical protein